MTCTESSSLIALPQMPRIAAVALTAARHCDGVAQLSDALRHDPDRAALLLQIANSAAGRGTPIYGRARTVREAIGLLGLRYAASVVVAGSLRPARPPPHTRRAVEAAWRDAVSIAAWARILGCCSPVRVRDPFLCGLLTCLGRLVLLHTPAAMQPDSDTHLDRADAAVGAATATAWRLPPWIVESIGHASPSSRPGFYAEVANTCLARDLARGRALSRHPSLPILGLEPVHLARARALAPVARSSVALLS